MELAPEGRQTLEPACWLGAERPPAFAARTSRQPSLRLYALADKPWAVGNGGIVDGGRFLGLDYSHFNESSRFAEFENAALVAGSSPESIGLRLPGTVLHVPGDCILLAQQGDRHWGHWLVDVLPRAALACGVVPGARLAVPSTLEGGTRLLELAGIARERLVLYDPHATVLSADRMFLPSFPRFANGFAPAVREMFARLSPGPRRRNRRLYVTRAGTRLGSTIADHAAIEALFVARGFDVVAPESLDVQSQLQLFAEASHVAGEYGSGLHNSVYSAEEVAVLCLQSDAVGQWVQAGIGAAMHQPTGFVFGPVDAAMTDGRPVSPSFRARCCRLQPALVHAGIDAMLGWPTR